MGNSAYLFGIVNVLTEFNSEAGELLQSKPIVKYLEIIVRFKNGNLRVLI